MLDFGTLVIIEILATRLIPLYILLVGYLLITLITFVLIVAIQRVSGSFFGTYANTYRDKYGFLDFSKCSMLFSYGASP